MINRIRNAFRSARGFTLIELLVVILIIGILAAVVIPALLGQASKGTDAAAKNLVSVAQTEVSIYGLDNNGYSNLSLANLSANAATESEGALQTQAGNGNPYLSAVGAGLTSTSSFYIVVTSTTGTMFESEYATNGQTYRFCAAKNVPGFPIISGSATVNAAYNGTTGGCVGGSW